MAARRVLRRRLLCLLLTAALPPSLYTRCGCAQSAAPLEQAVKATYLWKFASFVEWPPGTFASPESALVICVLGDAAFADLLDQAVAGQRISGHAITVKRVQTVGPDSGCQILFDAGSRQQPVPAALAAVRGAPVLTVTDANDGGPKGIINFVNAENHVRFEINDMAAAANHLAISSKLLSLAISVTPRSETRSAIGVA